MRPLDQPVELVITVKLMSDSENNSDLKDMEHGEKQLKEELFNRSRKDVPDKVVIQFKASGNAPVLRQNKVKISSTQCFKMINSFLRKQLNLKPSESIFLYVNSRFTPTPDESISNLYKVFMILFIDSMMINFSVLVPETDLL